VYHLAEGKNKSQRFFDEDLEEHQPFPTLHQALDCIDPHVGFNIEVKWTMQLKVCLGIFVLLLSKDSMSYK
jgi:glycerophosphocholine phosphodiesterase GPCPD1